MATTTVATKKRRAWTTSVFIKQLMAVSGFVFVFFLLFHSYGNLKMFLGEQVYNDYAHWLHEEAFVPIFPHGGFLWVFRAAMVLMLIIHLYAAAYTWLRSRRARSTRYVVVKSVSDSYAARTMRLTGVVLIFGIVFPLLHFTTASLPRQLANFGSETTAPYSRMIAAFQSPWLVLFYAVFVGVVLPGFDVVVAARAVVALGKVSGVAEQGTGNACTHDIQRLEKDQVDRDAQPQRQLHEVQRHTPDTEVLLLDDGFVVAGHQRKIPMQAGMKMALSSRMKPSRRGKEFMRVQVVSGMAAIITVLSVFWCRACGDSLFQRQQPFLDIERIGAAVVAGELAVLADNAVAGDDDRQRIVADSARDCPCAARIADGLGDVLITACRAVGNIAQRLPDPLLEGRARAVQRQVERAQATNEIRIQLCCSLAEKIRDRFLHNRAQMMRHTAIAGVAVAGQQPVAEDERAAPVAEQQIAERGGINLGADDVHKRRYHREKSILAGWCNIARVFVQTDDEMTPISRITLMGTSGVGKTTLATMLAAAGWFHYSGDYRIATRYLNEPISDWLTELARREPTLASLLRDDAVSVQGKVSIERLHILSAYIGKLGRDGYDATTFIERQHLFRAAEQAAMQDVPAFIERAERLYGYKAFINDAGGSICELDDPAMFQTLATHTCYIYIDTDEAHYAELEARAIAYPKPICYHPHFLQQMIGEYGLMKGGLTPDRFESDDFIRYVTPRMMAHRRERYRELIAQYGGIILNARDIWQLRDAADFHDLLNAAQRN